MGDLTFVIGGKEYTLPNDEWMFKETSGSSFAQVEEKTSKMFGPIGPELRGEDGSELIQHESNGISLAQSADLPGSGSNLCSSKL